MKNKKDNESGGNCKETPGKEVEVVWACDEKRGSLRRKAGDGNESTGRRKSYVQMLLIFESCFNTVLILFIYINNVLLNANIFK